jgi:hypothetical protein
VRTISQLNRRRHLTPSNRLAAVNRRRRWVLHLWEAFLVHMDDFDRLLELQLRRKLDALVASPVPPRRARTASADSSKRRDKETGAKSIGGVTDLGGALVLPS